MQCPKCRIDLHKEVSLKGALWQCPQCQGVAANLAVLRKLLGQDVALKFWRKARSSTPSNKSCPSCHRLLSVFTYPLDQHTVTLDLCKRCQIIWFDKGELEAFPVEPVVLGDWPPEVKQKLAIAQVREAYAHENKLEADSESLSRFVTITCQIFHIITRIILRV